ncbi:MAG: spore coat protein [Bacillota bacterium]|nr:spore coat protein [Bacillota bacterium]
MISESTVTSKSGVQKIGKPVSNELPTVKDANINLRDRLNDILTTEKHNLVNYQIAINELINEDLKQCAIDNRNRHQDFHNRLFIELFNLGEYQADIASAPQIKDTYEVFNNYKTQLPYKQ